MQNIRVPGLAWVALIMAVVGWLQGEWFAGEPWVPGVVLMLTAAAKLLQMYVWPDTTPPAARAPTPPAARSSFSGASRSC
jgi:hypothetical protein